MFNPMDVINKAQEMPSDFMEEMRNASLDTSRSKERQTIPVSDAYIDSRLRSDKPATFLDFIDDLRMLWDAAGNTAKIIRNRPLGEEADFPIITFKGAGRRINPEFKDLKPRYRTTVQHPYMDDQNVEIFGQIFDVGVEFSVYCTAAEEADELVIQLEDFLLTYAGYFKSKGVQEITFESQSADEIVEEARIGVAKRTLLYKIRFEKITIRYQNQINQIAVQAQILHEENN